VADGLFEAAFQWAKDRGLNRIIGPKGFTVFDGLGLLVKGYRHRPAFGLPNNLLFYASVIEACGFEPHGELVSGYLGRETPFPEEIHQLSKRIQARRGLRVINFHSRRELRSIVPALKDLYNASLGGTSGNFPLTYEEAKALANQMLWFSDPHLIKIVMKCSEAVGFLFAYLDISAAIQRTGGRLLSFGWLHWRLELSRTIWININGAGMVDGNRGLGGTA